MKISLAIFKGYGFEIRVLGVELPQNETL